MGLFASILNRFRGHDIDWDDLEETLIGGDLGVRLSTEIVGRLQKRKGKLDAESVVVACREEITAILGGDAVPLPPPGPPGKPTVILVAGVNGVGKTTSVAKLAAFLKDQGHGVVLAAADTFRAAAREQLAVWGNRNQVSVVSQEGADPGAVVFDAVQSARAKSIDVVIADTAGRLPTQLHLMEELKKIKRVTAKALEGAPHEVLLVVDGNTGQNALAQVRAFDEALGLTGLVVTKLDGTAKGGVLAAIALWGRERRNAEGQARPVPVYFIGVGEKLEDLETFDAQEFAQALLG